MPRPSGSGRAPVLKDVVFTEVNEMLALDRAAGPSTRGSPAACAGFCGRRRANVIPSVTVGEVRGHGH
jgi:hypothetical protein